MISTNNGTLNEVAMNPTKSVSRTAAEATDCETSRRC